MSIPEMKELLKTMPKRNGFGHDRKLDILQTGGRLATDLSQQIADYFENPKAYDIDILREECTMEAMRILLVFCEGKVNLLSEYAKNLVAANRQLHDEHYERTNP